MEEGMPISKIHKMPVECFDESLEVIERQASELFEEFLRLPQPAERRASTRSRTSRGKLMACDPCFLFFFNSGASKGPVFDVYKHVTTD